MKKLSPFRVVNIFGLKIPVYKVDGLLDNQDMYGFFDCEKKLICVDSGLKGSILEHTIVHEMFHATLDRLFVQHQLDEKFVEVIVENLTVSLVDNYSLKARE